jgi:hypothetical protein
MKAYTLISRSSSTNGTTKYLMVMPHKFGDAKFTEHSSLALAFSSLNEALQVAQNIGGLSVIELN